STNNNKDAGTTLGSSASISYSTRTANSQSESSKPQPESRGSQIPSGINTDGPPLQAKTTDVPQNVLSLILNDEQTQWILNTAGMMLCRELEIKTSPKSFLNLLYRGSRDGYRPSAFHKLCDNQGPTIAVIRTKENNEIIGGYNPTSWNRKNKGFTQTFHSFLFAVKSNRNVVSFCQSPATAVRNGTSYGPTFGRDLVLNGNFLYSANTTTKDSYGIAIRDSSEPFAVDEIEVFKF
ncbi:4761_t:CDS:2, partial [Paraglomus occultum]